MASWCNLLLVVAGHPVDLMRFRRAAGALRGRVDTSRSRVFTGDMEYGEGGDLEADGLTRIAGDLRRTSYRFQGRNTDHVDHFRKVSRRYPRLAFVLVVFDNLNSPGNGSYLLRRGRSRWWSMPGPLQDELFVRHLRESEVVPNWVPIDVNTVDLDDDTVDMAYWHAVFESMDLAAAKWETEVIAWLRSLPTVSPDRGSAATRRCR